MRWMMVVGLMAAGAVNAEPITWEPVGTESSTNYNSYYESSSGNRYEYNLNNRVDQIQYEYDRPAQIRDAYNPRTGIDRSMGQYGGGIYPEDQD